MASRRSRSARKPRTNVQPNGQPADPGEPTFAHRTAGRPSMLTAAVEKRFMDCMKTGNYGTVCARWVGLSPRTIEGWLARGRGNDPDHPPSPEYVRFARLYDESKAHAEVMVIGNLVARTAKDTRAAEVFLKGDPERRRRWMPQDDDEPPAGAPLRPQLPPGDGGSDTHVTIDQRQQYIVLTPDQLDSTVREMLERQRQERAARLAATTIIEPEQHTDGIRIARLDGLRSDEGEAREPDD